VVLNCGNQTVLNEEIPHSYGIGTENSVKISVWKAMGAAGSRRTLGRPGGWAEKGDKPLP
jgi:hypothetical protein